MLSLLQEEIHTVLTKTMVSKQLVLHILNSFGPKYWS